MPSTAPSHGVDPSAPGTIIRAALAFESILTVGAGAYYMFFPRHYLERSMGTAATQVTTAAIQVTQQYGAANALVGACVALFVPNTRNAIETRPVLYYAFTAFEALFVPLLVWQAYVQEGGIPKSSLLASTGLFIPFLAWRTFTLFWKREWFGHWREGEKME